MRGKFKVLIGVVIGVVIVAGVLVGAVSWARVLMKPKSDWMNPVIAHNEAIESVPIEDRAYPMLARFYARYSQMELPDEYGEASIGGEGWEDVEAWVSSPARQGLIGFLEIASECSVLGAPLHDYEDPIWVREMQGVGFWSEGRLTERSDGEVLLVNALLPMPGVIFQAGLVLENDARVAILHGDAQRLMRDVRIWSRLALFADEPLVLTGQIVQLQESAKIGRMIASFLHTNPELVGETQADELEEILGEMVDADVFVLDLELERVMMEDILRRMIDDEGSADYVQIRDFAPVIADGDSGVLPRASLVRLEDIEPELLAAYTHFVERGQARIDAIEMPWKSIRMLENEETWSDGFTTPAGEIGKTLFPVLSVNGEKLDKAVWLYRSNLQYSIGIRVALAAHRHWLRYGEPAMELSGIDEDLMGFDPVDGFTGEALKYRWVDGQPMVYAVGADGDDDEGKRVQTPDEPTGYVVITDEYLANPRDGDMVLYPWAN